MMPEAAALEQAASSTAASGAAPAKPAKHPLETNWCFWLRSAQHDKSQTNWDAQQVKGHTFGTVEDFWCMVNSVNNPFEMGGANCEYSVFRENIKPDYETDEFRNGGRIVLQLPSLSGKAAATKNYDTWVHLLLALIGENFDDVGGKYIGGLRLVTKKNGSKIEIWVVRSQLTEIDQLVQGVKEMAKPFFETPFTVKFAAFKGPQQFEI